MNYDLHYLSFQFQPSSAHVSMLYLILDFRIHRIRLLNFTPVQNSRCSAPELEYPTPSSVRRSLHNFSPISHSHITMPPNFVPSPPHHVQSTAFAPPECDEAIMRWPEEAMRLPREAPGSEFTCQCSTQGLQISCKSQALR